MARLRTSFVPVLSHAGGRLARVPTSGRWTWRCSSCGLEQFWADGWAVFASMADEDEGLYAHQNGGKGWPVHCPSPACVSIVTKAVQS